MDAVDTGDLFAVWDSSVGDWRAASKDVVKTAVTTGLVAADNKVTQYAAPSATGFSVQVQDGPTWLVLTPGAGYAAGTLVLPAVGGVENGQELLVNCTQSVGTLTVSGNGATVTGAPTALSANGFFRLRFDSVVSVWHRVG